MSGDKPILEMTPNPGCDLKEWLGLALTRFALGGVTIGDICESWMQSKPSVSCQKSNNPKQSLPACHFCQEIEGLVVCETPRRGWHVRCMNCGAQGPVHTESPEIASDLYRNQAPTTAEQP